MGEWTNLSHTDPPKIERSFLAGYLEERGQVPPLTSLSPLCPSLSFLRLSIPPPHPSVLCTQENLIFEESPSLMFLFFLDIMSEPLNSPSKGLSLCPFIAPLSSRSPWLCIEGRANHQPKQKPS